MDEDRRRAEAEYLRARQEAMQSVQSVQWERMGVNTYTTSAVDYTQVINIPMESSGLRPDVRPTKKAVPKKAATNKDPLKQYKDREAGWFKDLLASGIPGDLDVYIDDSGRIAVYDLDFSEGRLVLIYSPEDSEITANAARNKHLEKVLEELAERLACRLTLTKETLTFASDIKTVGYWPINGQEVDDSELVSRSRPIEPRREEPEMPTLTDDYLRQVWANVPF